MTLDYNPLLKGSYVRPELKVLINGDTVSDMYQKRSHAFSILSISWKNLQVDGLLVSARIEVSDQYSIPTHHSHFATEVTDMLHT
jgi:hypothetical protein